MKIEKRIELMKDKIKEKDFLDSKGLGNEVAFWIFDYPAEKELLIRDTIHKIKTNFEKQSIYILEIDLYNLCLGILQEKISFERITDFEKKKGSNELLNKLKPILKPEVFRDAILTKMDDTVDLVFLTGVGKVWPLVRSHAILNNLQSVITDVPLVMFYPGNYSGFDLSLFGKFKDTNYYRAFRLIND